MAANKGKETMEEDKEKKTRRPQEVRKLRKEGGTPVLTLGRLVPQDWRMVKVSVLETTDKEVTLKLERVA